MNIKSWTLQAEDLSGILNDGKEAIINGLQSEGYLTVDQAQEIKERYVLLLVQKGVFGKLLDKLFYGSEKDPLPFMQLAKLIRKNKNEEISK